MSSLQKLYPNRIVWDGILMRIKQNKTVNLHVTQNTEVFSDKTDGT